MTAAQLADAKAFEAEWDAELGGISTRVYREFLGFAVARMSQLGADPDGVIRYVGACFEIWKHWAEQRALEGDEGGRA
jgi:hypothetical protein